MLQCLVLMYSVDGFDVQYYNINFSILTSSHGWWIWSIHRTTEAKTCKRTWRFVELSSKQSAVFYFSKRFTSTLFQSAIFDIWWTQIHWTCGYLLLTILYSILSTLQPHYNMVVYSTNSVYNTVKAWLPLLILPVYKALIITLFWYNTDFLWTPTLVL